MGTRKVIVTVAPTGGLFGKETSPHLPTQPDEIIPVVTRCGELGASVAAIHARRPDDSATCDAAIYRQINQGIAATSEIVINNSTGGGVGDDLTTALPDGRMEIDFAARLEGTKAGAEMCTFDSQTLSMNVSGQEFLFHTSFERCVALAEHMRDAGIKPEWEIFSPADLETVKRLIAMGFDQAPHYVNIVLGTHKGFSGGMPYSPEILDLSIAMLPADSIFCVSAIGAAQLPATVQGILRGGHIRVGLEDNIYYAPGQLATNEQLVDRAVRLVHDLGADVATPAEARELIGLPPVSSRGPHGDDL